MPEQLNQHDTVSANIFVISGPSGCGKTTLIERLLVDHDNIVFSVSHTTRHRRDNEQQGKDYYFITEKRFQEMMSKGFMDEVRALYQRGDLGPELPSMRAVGYRQAWSCLAGEISRQTMTERAVIATRQYAKRQLTWLRGEENAQWFEYDAGKTCTRITDWLQQQLGNDEM